MKRHYWLVSSEVYKKGDLSVMCFIGETNVSSNNKFLSKKAIGDVRQGFLEYVISKGYPKDVNVFIKSISYIGEMTEAEWES